MNFAALADFIYDDLEAHLTCVRAREGGLELHVVCNDPKEDRKRFFRIDCHDLKEAQITPGWFDSIDTPADHPLLFDHTDDLGYLAFSSAPSAPEVVITRLYEAHRRICGDWRPFSKYVNHQNKEGLVALLRGGMGMIAQGPSRVMHAYQEATRDFLQTSLVNHALSVRPKLSVMLLGTDFVIAQKFEASEEEA
jgi:hypothetical protein